MDCSKVGKLISALRKEKYMTQKQVAQALLISDKTVSKWERGLGCPDVSLLKGLSEVLGVNIEKILDGDLIPNDLDGGNMKKVKFYVCPSCGNVITGTGEADISCCGRKLNALVPKKMDKDHAFTVEAIEDESYITFDHPMEKEHFVSFFAVATYDRVLLVKLYPEQTPAFRMPRMSSGKMYFYCSNHGLWVDK